jgi:hypothetical protein
MGAKVEKALAILLAIEAGEMLAALPDCPVARNHHLSALTLLKLAQHELAAIPMMVFGG